jgi:hypothetical protein
MAGGVVAFGPGGHFPCCLARRSCHTWGVRLSAIVSRPPKAQHVTARTVDAESTKRASARGNQGPQRHVMEHLSEVEANGREHDRA